jgi:hypothetical protein
MTVDPSKWLRAEVLDLLDVGTVGAFELIWLLRGQYPELGAQARIELAQAVLDQLRSEGTVRLVRLFWPYAIAPSRVEPDTVASEDWNDPQDGVPYLALDIP